MTTSKAILPLAAILGFSLAGAQSMLPTFEEIDLNKDRMITQQEFQEYDQNYPELEAKWQQFDENADGNLDQDEFAQFTADVMSSNADPDTDSKETSSTSN